MHVCVHVCMHACIYACMYACMHVCMHICMCACECVWVCMYMCLWSRAVCRGQRTAYQVLVLSSYHIGSVVKFRLPGVAASALAHWANLPALLCSLHKEKEQRIETLLSPSFPKPKDGVFTHAPMLSRPFLLFLYLLSIWQDFLLQACFQVCIL